MSATIPDGANRWTRPGSKWHEPGYTVPDYSSGDRQAQQVAMDEIVGGASSQSAKLSADNASDVQRAKGQGERASKGQSSETSYIAPAPETEWIEETGQSRDQAPNGRERHKDYRGAYSMPTDAVEASKTYAYNGGIPIVQPDQGATSAKIGPSGDTGGTTSASVNKAASTASVKAKGAKNGYMSPDGWVTGDPPADDEDEEDMDAETDAEEGGGGLIAVESTSSSSEASTLLGTPTPVESRSQEQAVSTGTLSSEGQGDQRGEQQWEGASTSETTLPTPTPAPSTLIEPTSTSMSDTQQQGSAFLASSSVSTETSASASTESGSLSTSSSAPGVPSSVDENSASTSASGSVSIGLSPSATFVWSGSLPTGNATSEPSTEPSMASSMATTDSTPPSSSTTASHLPDATENLTVHAQDTYSVGPSTSFPHSDTLPSKSGTAQGANKADDESTGPSKGTTAGAVIGGLIAVLILGTLAVCLLKTRRRNSDRRKMARSSWFYGGDVALPEDQAGRERSWLQSRFSAPSINGTYGQRLSSVVANFNPINFARPYSSRYPSSVTPGYASAERVETMSEVPPLPPIQSQGGWADRFFAQPEVQNGTGTPLPLVQAFPTPMIRNDSGPAHPLHVANRLSSGSGSTRQLAPFIRVDSASDRSSMTSSTDSTASVVHAASVDLSKTAAKNAVLQSLAQRPPSGLQYGASYAAPLSPPSVPLPQPPIDPQAYRVPSVPASATAKTNAESHWSSPFEYDRSTQRHSVADTSSVYSRNSAAVTVGPDMTARPNLVQRGGTISKFVVRDTMETTSSMYGVGAYHPREGADARSQQEGMLGDGIPRAL